MDKIRGTTKSGFHFKIDTEIFDDIELLEMIRDADDNDITAVSGIIEKLLGRKQKRKLYDHLRNEKGIVQASLVLQTIVEIFEQIKTLKK